MNLLIFTFRFIYCGESEFDDNSLLEVFKIAYEYEVKELVQISTDRLVKTINYQNLFHIYEQVYEFNQTKIESSISSLVQYNQIQWLTKEMVERLNQISMKFLLSQPTLGVSEYDLIDLTLHWAFTQIRKQTNKKITPQMVKDTLGDLFYLLRIPLLKMDKLINGPARSYLTDQNILDIVYYQTSSNHPKNGIVSKFNLKPRNLSHFKSVKVLPDSSFPPGFKAKKSYSSFKIQIVPPTDFCLAGLQLYTYYYVAFNIKVIIGNNEVYEKKVNPYSMYQQKTVNIRFDYCISMKQAVTAELLFEFDKTYTDQVRKYVFSKKHNGHTESEKFMDFTITHLFPDFYVHYLNIFTKDSSHLVAIKE